MRKKFVFTIKSKFLCDIIKKVEMKNAVANIWWWHNSNFNRLI